MFLKTLWSIPKYFKDTGDTHENVIKYLKKYCYVQHSANYCIRAYDDNAIPSKIDDTFREDPIEALEAAGDAKFLKDIILWLKDSKC